MEKKKEELLFKKFKWYHSEKSLSESLMSFGFMSGDGWFKLIKRLSEDIDREIRRLTEDVCKDFCVVEVKEKFGGLRFYVNYTPTDKIYELINKAEKESYKICEECGKKGKLRNKLSWWQTLCDKCLQKVIKRK